MAVDEDDCAARSGSGNAKGKLHISRPTSTFFQFFSTRACSTRENARADKEAQRERESARERQSGTQRAPTAGAGARRPELSCQPINS